MRYVEFISSYVPSLIIAHLLDPGDQDPTVKRNLPCVQYYKTVCLFADVSGFTKLSEAMAMMYGVGGAEYLAKHLNSYFQMMSRIIAADGGDIFKYAGDAVIVLWPDHDDLVTRARRAVQSGVSIQKALHKAELVVAKPEEGVQGVELSVKCGVGVGPVSVLHMGALLDRLEYVAVGDPLVQAFDAEHHAVSGDLICSKATWALVSEFFTAEKIDDHDGVAWVDTDAAYSQTRKVNKQHMLQGMLNTLESDPEVEDKVCMYLPGAVKGTLSGDSKQEGWGNELRSVVVVFVNLGLKNHDLLAAATYHEARCRAHDVLFAVQKAVYAYEGSVNKFLMDDKGSTLIAVWGLPPLAHENDSLRAVLASLNLCAALEKLGLSASCGITTGTAFCGVVGSTTRKEYSVLGDCVNLSARLMQASCGYGGGIICDKATTDLVGSLLKFQHLAPIFVKGKSVPISIAKPYVIPESEIDDASSSKMGMLYSKQLAFFDKANAVRPVVNGDLGRTPNAKRIVQVLSTASSGGGGDTNVVLVTGEMGVGKSTLLSHCLHTIRATERETPVVCVATDPFRRHLACDIWARVVVSYLRDIFRISSLHDPEVRTMLEQEAGELMEFYPTLIEALKFGYGGWESMEAAEAAGADMEALRSEETVEGEETRSAGALVVGTPEHSALLRALLLAMVRACRQRLGPRPMVILIDAGLYIGDEGWQLALELLGEAPVANAAVPPAPVQAYKRRLASARAISNSLRLVVTTRPLHFYTDAACSVASPAYEKLRALSVTEVVAMDTRMAPRTMSNLFLQNLEMRGAVRPTTLGKTALQLIQHLSVSNPSVVKELALSMSRATPPQIAVMDGKVELDLQHIPQSLCHPKWSDSVRASMQADDTIFAMSPVPLSVQLQYGMKLDRLNFCQQIILKVGCIIAGDSLAFSEEALAEAFPLDEMKPHLADEIVNLEERALVYKLLQDGEEKVFFTDPLFVFVVSGRMLIDQREKVGSRMVRLHKQHKASEKNEMIEKMRALGTERLPSLTFEALVRKQGEGFDVKAPRGKGTGSRRSKAKTSLRSLLGDVTKGRWRTRSVALHFSEGGQVPNMYIFKSMVDDIDQSIANDPSVKSAPVEGNSVTLEGDNFEGKNNVVRIGVRRWTNKGVEINTSTEFVISFKTAGAVEQFTRWVEWSSSLVSAKHQKRKEASRSAASKSRAAELEDSVFDDDDEVGEPTWRETDGPNLRGSLSDFWRVVGKVGTMDIARRGAMLYRARSDMSSNAPGEGGGGALSASLLPATLPVRAAPPAGRQVSVALTARANSGARILQRSDLDDLTRAWLTQEFMRGVTSSTSAELSAEGTVPLQPGEGALAGSQANISETDEFFYTDDLGKEHGPFSVEMLREWFKAGYFDRKKALTSKQSRSEVTLGDVLDSPFKQRMAITSLDAWTFNLRSVAEEKKSSVVVTMFASYGLLSAFSIPVATFGGLASILREAANVNGNAFHNWDHTLDALHAVWWLMRRGIATRVSKLEILGALTASICLCLDHPGVGNPFLVSSHSPLALTYNDESPLQSHAAAAAFALMNRDDGACDILIHLNDAQYRFVRRVVISCILASDSARSFEVADKAKAAAEVMVADPTARLQEDARLAVLEAAVCWGNVSYTSRENSVHKEWAAFLSQELIRQGEREREGSLPESPFCDAQQSQSALFHLNMIDLIASPVLHPLLSFAPGAASSLIGEMGTNRSGWLAKVRTERRGAAFAELKAAHGATVGASGWRTMIDAETGAAYHYNEKTGASQWDAPS